MVTLSTPVFAMAAVSFYAGIYHILYCIGKIGFKQNLFFALLCFSVAYYQIASGFLYLSQDCLTSIKPSHNLFCSVSLISIFALWFIVFITEQKKITPLHYISTITFSLFFISSFFMPDSLISQTDSWWRHISIKGLIDTQLLQIRPGRLWILQNIVTMLLFLYLIFLLIRYSINKPTRGIKAIIASCIVLFAAAIHDILAENGFADFINMVEYAYSLLIFSMAYLLVNMFTDVKKKLAILNASLEQKVIMQTVKLCEALEEVETANKKLFKISNTDPLTQLANRRSFFKVFSKEWKRACRNKSSVSIILLDIDNFKQYNDTYGHIAGDACLEKVAGILKKSAKRPLDLVARYGGEEFIILLPETDAKGAICVAESIRKALIAENIEHKNSATADRVTISAGCATAFPTMNDPRNNFINAADEALYNSKDNGRNLTTSINFYSRYK